MTDTDDTSLEPPCEDKKFEIISPRCGKMTVHVQGDLENAEKKAVFLTVHDIGSNHSSFQDFVEHPCMLEIKPRSVFIHVDVPGQEDNAADYPSEQFPTIQMIGEDLVTVLDHLKVHLVVGFGEGSGANILVRFAMAHQSRVLGLVLVHCVATSIGMMEYFKDKFLNWKLTSVGMNPSAEQFLVLHKFGAQLEMVENKEKLIQDYTDKLKKRINPRNLRRYVEAYMNRKDLTTALETTLRGLDFLLVCGGKGAHVQAVQGMYAKMDKQKTALLKVDNVGDILNEAPEKLASPHGLDCLGSIAPEGRWGIQPTNSKAIDKRYPKTAINIFFLPAENFSHVQSPSNRTTGVVPRNTKLCFYRRTRDSGKL